MVPAGENLEDGVTHDGDVGGRGSEVRRFERCAGRRGWSGGLEPGEFEIN